jgi:hypothetical protein
MTVYWSQSVRTYESDSVRAHERMSGERSVRVKRSSHLGNTSALTIMPNPSLPMRMLLA